MRLSRRQHGHLCPLNFLSLCRSEMTIRFSLRQLSRSSFSLRSNPLALPFQPISLGSTSLSARPLLTRVFLELVSGSAWEVVLTLPSVLLWESQMAWAQMLVLVSEWAIRFRSSLPLREALAFPLHPILADGVRAKEKVLRAAAAHQLLAP